MNEDTIKDIIRDAKEFSLDCTNAALLRMGLKRISERLEELVAGGLYITPKAALDIVAGERPLDKMLKTPFDAVTANPQMSEGVGLAGRKRFYSMPELGITFNRVASPKCVRLTAYFRAVPKPGCGKPDKNCDHVYEVRIDRDMSVCPSPWVARAYVDDTLSFTVCAGGRCKCELLALAAFKGYLHRVLRKSRRNRKLKG